MKRVWKILIAAAVVVVALVVVLIFTFDSLAKAGLEKGATAALGTKTAVDRVGISLLGGSLELSRLTVANPEGFGEGDLMELGEAAVGLSVGSLLSDTVQIRQIVLDRPVLKLVQKGRETNLSAVLKNADEFAGGGESEEGGGDAAGKKLRIGLVKITNARFEYRLAGAPAVKVNLPDIELKDLSDEKGKPLLVADLFAKVMMSMTASALKQPGTLLPSDLTDSLKDVGYGGKKILEGVLRETGSAIEKTGGIVKSVGDLLTGLKKNGGEEKPEGD